MAVDIVKGCVVDEDVCWGTGLRRKSRGRRDYTGCGRCRMGGGEGGLQADFQPRGFRGSLAISTY